ncbi:MAG: TusE/DsrC/DsvC family sulfur relay protein, partial [Actinomycetota bacterium]|nr:TusE/DsrC/DsvC family sulfur relay protein [Actinomycetota bacterium]
EDIAKVLAQQIDVDLTDEHWKVLRFLREDYKTEGESATTRRVQTVGGIPVKEQFALFPKKPAKKMAYIAGLPKPKGCV